MRGKHVEPGQKDPDEQGTKQQRCGKDGHRFSISHARFHETSQDAA
jgi:hypothetical protein